MNFAGATNYYDVDVDNSKWQPNLNSIATHSKIADYYKYRPPYLGMVCITPPKLELMHECSYGNQR
jgi:hypothetical protein